MRRCFLPTAVMALCAAPLQAVRITGELVARVGSEKSVWTLNGTNFSIRTEQRILETPPGPFMSDCHFVGCGPGDSVFMDGGLSIDSGPTSGTIDGIFYPSLFLGDSATDTGTTLSYGAPTITLTDALVYTVPATLSGVLAVYLDAETCVLCGRIGDPNVPTFDRPLRVTGAGFATLTLRPSDIPGDGGPWMLDNVVYEFVIPEPSTFVLVCTAFAVYLVVFVSRRHLSHRVENR